jgi:hypothetical protein
VLRSPHSRNMAEADTEEAAVVVSMEAVAEVASTVVEEAADSMEAVVAVIAELIAAAVVCTAVDRRAAPLEAWVRMAAAAAGMRRADTAAERTAGDRVARMAVALQEIRQARGTARARVRGVQIH